MRPIATTGVCDRCNAPVAPELALIHYCWSEKRAKAAIIRAIRYWTEDPDRCDMEFREDEVADTVLERLRGDRLIPQLWRESPSPRPYTPPGGLPDIDD